MRVIAFFCSFLFIFQCILLGMNKEDYINYHRSAGSALQTKQDSTPAIKRLIKQIQKLDPSTEEKPYTHEQIETFIKKIIYQIIQVINAQEIIDEHFKQANYKHINKILYLPSLNFNEGCTVLHLAIIFCNLKAIKILVGAGANPFQRCIYTNPETGRSEWMDPEALAAFKAKDPKTFEYLKQYRELRSWFPEMYDHYQQKRKKQPKREENHSKSPKKHKFGCSIV